MTVFIKTEFFFWKIWEGVDFGLSLSFKIAASDTCILVYWCKNNNLRDPKEMNDECANERFLPWVKVGYLINKTDWILVSF